MQPVMVNSDFKPQVLYGDSLMLGYSTTGQLTGSVRQGVMTFNDKLSETSIDNVFDIPRA